MLGRRDSAGWAFPAELRLTELPEAVSPWQLFAEFRHRGLRVPPLFLSWYQFWLITGVSIVLLLASIWNGLPLQDLAVVLCGGLVVWGIRLVIARCLFGRVPIAKTVGELAQQLLWKNPKYFSRLSGIPLTHELIKKIVVQHLVEMTGCDEDEITEETQLAELL